MLRWFCHIDDDTYVNVPALVKLLQQYNHSDDWYLGKPSLKHPIEIVDRENQGVSVPNTSSHLINLYRDISRM